MGRTVDLKPARGIDLVVADLSANPLCKDLRAAPREAVESCITEGQQDLFIGHVILLGVVVNLYGRKPLDVEVWTLVLQRAKQVGVVRERQVGIEPIDDVHFGHKSGPQRPKPAQRLLQRHGVRARVTCLEPCEAAEHAAGLTHVRGVDVLVAVEVRQVTVALLPHPVGKCTDGCNMGCLEEPPTILHGQARA